MVALTLPILAETFFRVLVMSVDTFMLSGYSQAAVAAVGLVGQWVFFINIMFNVIAVGTSIVLAQYLGAERHGEASHVAQAGAVMAMVTALAIMAGVLLGSGALLSLYPIEKDVRDFAFRYFTIFGGLGAPFIAFNMLQSTVLRSYGHTKDTMFTTMFANLVNVVGNAISLYGFFGLPVFGVTGVAISSVFSQFVACAILASRIRAKPDVRFPIRGWREVPRRIYKTVLSIGVPTAGENLAYNTAQIAIMAMVSTFGTFAMSAQVYTITIARFVYVFAMSIGTATQIKTGWFVGAKKSEDAYRRVYRYQIVGTLISVAMILVINLIKAPLIGFFTHEAEIAALASTLLLFSIYVEFGRSLNLVTISALKGSGDVRFPVFYGVLSMWGIMVFGSWLLGMKLGLGLVGVWIATGTDETTRGITMILRWKSKRWMTKRIA